MIFSSSGKIPELAWLELKWWCSCLRTYSGDRAYLNNKPLLKTYYVQGTVLGDASCWKHVIFYKGKHEATHSVWASISEHNSWDKVKNTQQDTFAFMNSVDWMVHVCLFLLSLHFQISPRCCFPFFSPVLSKLWFFCSLGGLSIRLTWVKSHHSEWWVGNSWDNTFGLSWGRMRWWR